MVIPGRSLSSVSVFPFLCRLGLISILLMALCVPVARGYSSAAAAAKAVMQRRISILTRPCKGTVRAPHRYGYRYTHGLVGGVPHDHTEGSPLITTLHPPLSTSSSLSSHEHHDGGIDMSFIRSRRFSTISPASGPRPLIPRLVLITGATGTGKSTLGMAVAFSEGMLKCVSTDTIREVARAYDDSDIIQRPSYGGAGTAVGDWEESVMGLDKSVRSVVDHTIKRRKSMVLEGVSIAPTNAYIDQFSAGGGVGLGVMLRISNENKHRDHLVRRGFETQLKNFDRIRSIQDRMVELAVTNGWLIVEQADIKDNVKEITTKLRTLYS